MEMKNVVKQKQVDTLIDSIRKLWQGTLKDPKDEVNMEETLAWIEALHTRVIDKDIYGWNVANKDINSLVDTYENLMIYYLAFIRLSMMVCSKTCKTFDLTSDDKSLVVRTSLAQYSLMTHEIAFSGPCDACCFTIYNNDDRYQDLISIEIIFSYEKNLGLVCGDPLDVSKWFNGDSNSPQIGLEIRINDARENDWLIYDFTSKSFIELSARLIKCLSEYYRSL